MAVPRGADHPFVLGVPLLTPVTHTLAATGFESATRSRLGKIITDTMDHTNVLQIIAVGESVPRSDPLGTTSTLTSFVCSLSSALTAILVTPTDTASIFITSPATIIPYSTFGNSTSTISSSASSTLPTMSPTMTPVSPPPASAYTTGLYIALGLFLFFGALCALVTSPAVATGVKAFFNRRTAQPEQ